MKHKLPLFNQKVPRSKTTRSEIDAMPHGSYRDFVDEFKAHYFKQSIYQLSRTYERRVFGVMRQIDNFYRVWVLRY